MHKLRSLQLFGNNLTNEGLTATLDNCPHLESLDTLRGKCARIKTLRLPHDSNCWLWLSGPEPYLASLPQWFSKWRRPLRLWLWCNGVWFWLRYGLGELTWLLWSLLLPSRAWWKRQDASQGYACAHEVSSVGFSHCICDLLLVLENF
jgi:hypothetical protein